MNPSKISLGTVSEISNRRYSKWPYWLYYSYRHDFMLAESHRKCQLQLLIENQSVVVENTWGTFTMRNDYSKVYKKKVGILYKFSDEMDRLVFMMKYA